jgi:uncharacterized DUF497 family protein
VWDAWNIEHIQRHGITPLDIEWLLSNKNPEPLFQGSRLGTLSIWGKDESGRYLLVVLARRDSNAFYPVTARMMTERETNHYKKNQR